LGINLAAIGARGYPDAPFEESIEIAGVLEPEAESDLLYRYIHLTETHTGVLHQSVEDESTGRVARVTHTDSVKPILGDAESVGITFDAPVLPIAEFDELPELLKHKVACAAQASLCGGIALREAPDVKAH
jgi:hypothetical protein